MKMLNNIENKGEFDDFSQIGRMKNCAMSDAVAQLKTKWRNLGGSSLNQNFFSTEGFVDESFESAKSISCCHSSSANLAC
jgi:hypothetical protein